jgi:hypothetical protein
MPKHRTNHPVDPDTKKNKHVDTIQLLRCEATKLRRDQATKNQVVEGEASTPGATHGAQIVT